MVQINNIHPLTDFKRNTAAFRERLRASGLPEVLTVEGRPELVVQDAAAYQRMLDAIDRGETHEAIRKGIEAMERGEGVSWKKFDTAMRRKYKIKRRKP